MIVKTDTVIGGYRIFFYENENDKKPKVLHEPLSSKTNKLTSGKINQGANKVDEFTFIISMQNSYYRKLKEIVNIIEVVNLYDDTIEFRGRILEISSEMDVGGVFHQEIICESQLGYLNDMTLMYEKFPNKGVEDYLRHVIDFHNQRVEPFKHFKIGKVTVPNRTDKPYFFCSYETTWDCIKERIVGQFGGYLIMRAERDGNYIDYLETVGEHKKSPIQLGRNIKSASRNISLADMMTQIVPIGGDLDNGEVETGSDVVRDQVTIGSVTGGPLYLSDTELIKEFGIIRKIVQWSEITDPYILKARGQQYLDNQKVALANWKVSVVDLALIDERYEKFKLYNYHPVLNAPISGIEELQIIEKEIDIINPQLVDLTIGADRLTLSSFQLQQQSAQKSMEKLLNDAEIARKQSEAEAAYNTQLSLLTAELNQYIALSTSYANEINDLTAQISSLDPATDQSLIASLTAQKNTAITNKNIYGQKVIDIQNQIDTLKGGA